MRQLRRRRFLFAASAVFLSPLSSNAQQRPRVGVLRFGDLESSKPYIEALKRGLGELGYIEGRNLTLELRFADGKAERLPGLATDLVKLKVDVILAADTPSTRAAQRATKTIPIVMANIIDPVGSGFVASLARPGGNITGLSNMMSETSPKQLELLVNIVPKLSQIAVLLNPANSAHRTLLKSIETAAQRTGLRVFPMEADTSEKIDSAFSAMNRQHVGALIVTPDAFFGERQAQIAQLAVAGHIPTIGGSRNYAEVGMLVSYGQDTADFWRRSATYVDKILKGARPADLPVQQPATFDLVVNAKTAKALGITIPQSILQRADRVIE